MKKFHSSCWSQWKPAFPALAKATAELSLIWILLYLSHRFQKLKIYTGLKQVRNRASNSSKACSLHLLTSKSQLLEGPLPNSQLCAWSTRKSCWVRLWSPKGKGGKEPKRQRGKIPWQLRLRCAPRPQGGAAGAAPGPARPGPRKHRPEERDPAPKKSQRAGAEIWSGKR